MLDLPDAWVWDFWLVEAPDANGARRYHCFFLFASRALGDADRRHRRAGIGHAVSDDLRHWTRLPDALVHADPPAFDDLATWTGSIVAGPDGRWRLFYTGVTDTALGLRERIGLASSDDLITWTRDPRGALVDADARWYETLGDAEVSEEAWRDPWVLADPSGAGWHLLITARAKDGPLDERGVIGHATSPDLAAWTVQPPLSAPGHGFWHFEVMQVVEIDGRHWLVFSCLPAGRSERTRAAAGDGAIWVAAGASPLGPFDLAHATALAGEGLYVGKLVRDVTGDWALLAFRDRGPDGAFIGGITDPLPVRVTATTIELAA